MKMEEFLKLSDKEKARVCQDILNGSTEIKENEKQRQVLECLGNKEMTAREVLIEMIKKGDTEIDDRNGVAPRLTELFEAGKLVIVAKKMDIETGRMTAVYRRAYEEVH